MDANVRTLHIKDKKIIMQPRFKVKSVSRLYWVIYNSNSLP